MLISSYFTTCPDGGGGGGGWGKAENKAKLSPAGAGSWAELGNISLHTPIIMAEIYAICDVGDSAEHSVTSMLLLEGLTE